MWRVLFASVMALGLLGAASSPAVAQKWLVLLVDRSNSIDDRELALQRDAYVRLLSDAAVIQALADTQVAIVEFDTRPEIVVDWTDPASAARAYGQKPRAKYRGQTGIGHAITTGLGLLAGKSGRLIIDISGDGKDNVDSLLLADARAHATKLAIEINGLAILNEESPALDVYYSRAVVNGFVLPVDQREDFYTALRRKLFFEVAGIDLEPPPAR